MCKQWVSMGMHWIKKVEKRGKEGAEMAQERGRRAISQLLLAVKVKQTVSDIKNSGELMVY